MQWNAMIPGILVVAGATCLLGAILLIANRLIRRRLAAMEADAARRIAQAFQAAEQRLTERHGELSRLLAEADRQIAAAPRDAGTSESDAFPPVHPRSAEIGRLAAQGVATVEIARRLGIDVGEVELVVNLARSAGGAAEVPAEGR